MTYEQYEVELIRCLRKVFLEQDCFKMMSKFEDIIRDRFSKDVSSDKLCAEIIKIKIKMVVEDIDDDEDEDEDD
jgi:hypothetical protein